mgnify:CR=1 FL=1
MKTKLSILLLAGVFFLATKTQAEIKTLVVKASDQDVASLEVKEGEVAKCIYWNVISRPTGGVFYVSSDLTVIKNDIHISILKSGGTQDNIGADISIGSAFPIVTGPAEIKLRGSSNNSTGGIASFEITPNETATSKAAGPALVLPEGEDGKQKLVLESSTDLVNWTEDSLGSKDSSDKKRFYRLRAVKE